MTLQCLSKEALGGTGTTSSLYEDVDYIAILIDGSPKIMDLPADGDEDFVDMPTVAELTFSTLEPSADTETELQTPAANRLVRYFYTPFDKEIFNIAEAQVESIIEPDSITDNFGKESVTVISGFAFVHPHSVPKLALM